MVGYITVTVPDGDGAHAELKACRRGATAASKARLEIRRPYAEQAGRGRPSRRRPRRGGAPPGAAPGFAGGRVAAPHPDPEESSACELAVRAATATSPQPTLPQVADALLRPTEDAARSIATDVEDLRRGSRQVAL